VVTLKERASLAKTGTVDKPDLKEFNEGLRTMSGGRVFQTGQTLTEKNCFMYTSFQYSCLLSHSTLITRLASLVAYSFLKPKRFDVIKSFVYSSVLLVRVVSVMFEACTINILPIQSAAFLFFHQDY